MGTLDYRPYDDEEREFHRQKTGRIVGRIYLYTTVVATLGVTAAILLGLAYFFYELAKNLR